MATLEHDPNSGRIRIRFRYGGVGYKRSLKTTDLKVAQTILARANDTIRLLEHGRIEMPETADPGTFILSDGRRAAKTEIPKVRTLGRLFKAYCENLPPGAKEESTMEAESRHMQHLERLLSKNSVVQNLAVPQMQGYVKSRSREKWNGKNIGPATISKELTTFRFIWNWGVAHGHLNGPAPIKGISLPKTDEKPPFMTLDEIERAIERGGLSEQEKTELWGSLFLRTSEVDRLLSYVRTASKHPFILPMFAIVAHTGARRSEIVRGEIDDFDFRTGTVRLREKKKSRKKAITFRRVPMTEMVRDVMTCWFAAHPGGRWVFPSTSMPATTSKNQSMAMNGDQATYYFNSTLAGSEWSNVPGFHLFRHSFASNCALAGLDQRIIDEWMGHQTDEMRRRYRHLFPEQQRTAIESVFARNGK